MSSTSFLHRLSKQLQLRQHLKKVTARHIQLGLLWGLVVFVLGYSWILSYESCLWKSEWCGQDMDQYVDYSDSLLAGQGFAAKKVATMYFVDINEHPNYVPEVLRLPAYSVLLTLGRLVFDSPVIALLYNFLFMLMILVYSVLLLRKFVSGWLGILAFGLIALNSSLIFYTAWFGNVDTMVAACLTGFFYHALQLIESKKIRVHIVFSALLSVLTVLSRQNTLIFILPFLVGLIGSLVMNRVSNLRILAVACVTAITLLSLGAWGVRNYFILGKFSLSEASGGQLFGELIYFTPYPTTRSQELSVWFYSELAGKPFMKERLDQGMTVPKAYAELNNELMKISLEYIQQYPQVVLQHFFKAVHVFYTVVPFGWEKDDLLAKLMKIQPFINQILLYLSLLVPGLVLVKPYRQAFIWLNVWVATLLFTLTSTFFHGIVIGNRGFLPVQPITVLMIGVLIDSAISSFIRLIQVKHANAK